jgi:hypothetical protein
MMREWASALALKANVAALKIASAGSSPTTGASGATNQADILRSGFVTARLTSVFQPPE